MLVAIFPADPRAAPILFQLHSLSALLGFGSLAIAAPVWVHRLRKAVRGRGDALAYVMLGWLLFPSLVGFLVSPPQVQRNYLHPRPIMGESLSLSERRRVFLDRLVALQALLQAAS